MQRSKLPMVVSNHEMKYDLLEKARPWAHFCEISDSTINDGSYSGATPNEKIRGDKLTEDTPMSVVESDATIVARDDAHRAPQVEDEGEDEDEDEGESEPEGRRRNHQGVARRDQEAPREDEVRPRCAKARGRAATCLPEGNRERHRATARRCPRSSAHSRGRLRPRRRPALHPRSPSSPTRRTTPRCPCHR